MQNKSCLIMFLFIILLCKFVVNILLQSFPELLVLMDVIVNVL